MQTEHHKTVMTTKIFQQQKSDSINAQKTSVILHSGQMLINITLSANSYGMTKRQKKLLSLCQCNIVALNSVKDY